MSGGMSDWDLKVLTRGLWIATAGTAAFIITGPSLTLWQMAILTIPNGIGLGLSLGIVNGLSRAEGTEADD